MQGKIKRFVQVLDGLGLPYTNPQGGYFVPANFSRLKFPKAYELSSSVVSRPRDFKLSWLLITELGLAAIPPSKSRRVENSHVDENSFVVCRL